jgi:hypothetical protein
VEHFAEHLAAVGLDDVVGASLTGLLDKIQFAFNQNSSQEIMFINVYPFTVNGAFMILLARARTVF